MHTATEAAQRSCETEPVSHASPRFLDMTRPSLAVQFTARPSPLTCLLRNTNQNAATRGRKNPSSKPHPRTQRGTVSESSQSSTSAMHAQSERHAGPLHIFDVMKMLKRTQHHRKSTQYTPTITNSTLGVGTDGSPSPNPGDRRPRTEDVVVAGSISASSSQLSRQLLLLLPM